MANLAKSHPIFLFDPFNYVSLTIMFQNMPSYAFLERDDNTHGELIQKAYSYLLSDNEKNEIQVTLKHEKKVCVNGSIFKLFSPFISSIVSDIPFSDLEIILPDFSEKHFRCLVEILTEGSTTTDSFKDASVAVKKIKSLAKCLNINMGNLLSIEVHHPPEGSLTIGSLSQQFIDSEVPNVLEENKDDENHDDNDVMIIEQVSSSKMVQIISSDDEDTPIENHSRIPLYARVNANDVVVNSIEPRSRSESVDRVSINSSISASINNNEEVEEYKCMECFRKKKFKSVNDLNKHKLEQHSTPRIQCLLCNGYERFFTAKDLSRHIISTHFQKRHKSCPQCFKVTKGPVKLAKHMIKSHYSFRCQICFKECVTLHNLNEHMFKKHPKSKAICPIDSRKLKSKYDLIPHT